MNKNHYVSGFTPLGVAIFIAIFLVAVIFLVTNFSGGFGLGLIGFFSDNADLDEIAQAILSDIQEIKANSIKADNGLWGLCFRNPATGNDFYIKSSNITLPDNACTLGGSAKSIREVKLPESIFFKNPAEGDIKSLVFKADGTALSIVDIVIVVADENSERIIRISPTGVITYVIPGISSTIIEPSTLVSTLTPAVNNETAAVNGGLSVPGSPRSLVGRGFNSQVRLDWSPPLSTGGTAINSYTIMRGLSSGGKVAIATVSATTHTYSDFNVTNNTTYYYVVRAVSSAGLGLQSNEVVIIPFSSIITPVQAISQAPSAPQNLFASAGQGNIFLNWSRPLSDGSSQIIEYRLSRGFCSGCETFYTAISSGNTSYTDFSVLTGTTYYYKIEARNVYGSSPQSNEVLATPFVTNAISTSSVGQTPSAPQNLNATAGQGNVSLSWSAPSSQGSSGIFEYRILRGTCSGCETFYAIVQSGTTSYSDSNVINDTTYYYRVEARNSQGVGSRSNIISATPFSSIAPSVASQTPSAPQNLNAIAGQGSASLSWSSPASQGSSAILQYRILRGTCSGCENLYATVSVGTTSYTDSNVINGTIYHYKVEARNSQGIGLASNSVSAAPFSNVTPPSAPPAPPVSPTPPAPPASTPPASPTQAPSTPQIASTSSTSSSITITWNVSSNNPTEYQIYKKMCSNCARAWIATILASNPRTYTNAGLSPNMEYFYDITAKNLYGTSPYLNVSVRTANPPIVSNTPPSITPPSSTAPSISPISPAPSTPPSATTQFIYAPSSPQIASVFGASNFITITWNNSSNSPTEYQIYKKLCSTCTRFWVATIFASNPRTYTNSGLNSNTEYFYEIIAVNSAGSSSPSSVSARTASITASSPSSTPSPNPPTSPSPSNPPPPPTSPDSPTSPNPPTSPVYPPSAPVIVGISSSSNSVTITWDASSNNPTDYQIYKKSCSTCSRYWIATILASNPRTYTNVGLASNTEYFYEVVGVNSAGSSLSSGVSIRTK